MLVVNCRMPAAEVKALRAIAVEEDRPVSQVVRRLLRSGLQQRKKERKR